MTSGKRPGVLALLLLLSATFCGTPIQATLWSPVINIDPSTQEDDRYPVPAITPDGTAWVFWHSYDPIDHDLDIYYSRWDGQSWTPRATVNPPYTTPDDIVRVSCASDGTLWTLWRAPRLDGSDNYLGLTSRWLGGAWSWPDTVWFDADRYNNTDLFAVSSDEAWFIRDASGGDALVYHHIGGTHDPVHRIDLPSAAVYQSTIAVDASGVVWAAWTHQETYPTPERLEFSRRVDGIWTQPEILPLPVEIKLPRLSVDRDDVKWIVCAGDDPASTYKGDDIWALRWNGNAWDSPTRISDPIQSNDSLQVYNALSRTPGEYPRVVWVRANIHNYTRTDVMTTAWDGTKWSPAELVGNLADSSYVNWPEVAVRGALTWAAWMADVGKPVFNILSTHSLDAGAVTQGVNFEVTPNPAGIVLTWSARPSAQVLRLTIHRAWGRFDVSQPDPPPASAVVAELDQNLARAGSQLDRGLVPGAEYSYWLEIRLAAGAISWIGPRVGATVPRSRSWRLSEAPAWPLRSVALRGSGSVEAPDDVRIFDVQGRLVRRISVAQQRGNESAPGRFEVVWDGHNQSGASAPAGVYFARCYGQNPSIERPTLKFLLLR